MSYIVIVILTIILLIIIVISINRVNFLFNTIFKYEKIISDQGKKNHEYNNQLLVLLGYIDNPVKLKKYLYTIIDDHKTGQNYEIRQLSNLPDGGIKKLLYYKLKKMKFKNIDCCLYVCEDVGKLIERINIDLYKDLTKVLGVLIDNSIDAAKKSEDKNIFLDFKEEGNILNITISNSVNDNNLIKNIGKKKFTTKGEGHGYGLLLVKDICKKNKSIDIVSKYENNMFCQDICVELV